MATAGAIGDDCRTISGDGFGNPYQWVPPVIEFIELTGAEIWEIAARMPGDLVALALALECHGVGAEDFHLPMQQLAEINFLPGWSRQNYRTRLPRCLGLGLGIDQV